MVCWVQERPEQALFHLKGNVHSDWTPKLSHSLFFRTTRVGVLMAQMLLESSALPSPCLSPPVLDPTASLDKAHGNEEQTITHHPCPGPGGFPPSQVLPTHRAVLLQPSLPSLPSQRPIAAADSHAELLWLKEIDFFFFPLCKQI